MFHSVATPTAIWKADPYDVETIHAKPAAAFEHVLNRAGRTPPPPSGAVLVLLGEAGSGKTHLMRAFRTRRHGQGLGYCGYLQMTAEASNYARYMLTNLIDGLEQPYDPSGPSRHRARPVVGGVLESVPGLSGIDMDAFRDGDGDGDPARLADDYADRLQKAPSLPRMRPRTAPGDAAPGTDRAAGAQSGADVAALPGNAARRTASGSATRFRAPTTATR